MSEPSESESLAEMIDRYLVEAYDTKLRATVAWCAFCGQTHKGALTAECPNPPTLNQLRGITDPGDSAS